MSLVDCGKTKYAVEKVREAVREADTELLQPPTKPSHKAKVVVLGNSGVGKTSIIYRHRFGADSRVSPFNSTIAASFVTCDVETEDELVRLQVWDTAGQERFRCMVPMYMRNATAAIIVYDVTCRQSFLDVDRWTQELQRCCGQLDPLLILIGNKCDVEEKRMVAHGEGVTKALEMNARFYEISAHNPAAFSVVLSDLAADIDDQEQSVCNIEKIQPLGTAPVLLEKTGGDKAIRTKCCSFM